MSLTLDCSELSPLQLQNYLQYAIAPRPICLASTIDAQGNVNLSPFSFFNLFSTNPPVCIFSPARRVRDNTTKHTLQNVEEVRECVVNIVNYDMVQQTSLSSTEYAKCINEFEKAGFTMAASQLVRPPRVAEAPVSLECTVSQIIPLGDQHGAGNLVLAEIRLIHIHEDILDSGGNIDQEKIDLVARLGGNWYARITPESLFTVPKPLTTLGIGVDALPLSARHSKILSGNDMGLLGNQQQLPSPQELSDLRQQPQVKAILAACQGNAADQQRELHLLAKQLISEGDISKALALVSL